MRSLPFEMIGNKAAPGLLFLHGFLGERRDWQYVAQSLSERAFCLAVDLPGHGQAAHLNMNFAETTAAIIALLDTLGILQIGLVGYSMGGRIALHAALRSPQRFQFVILVSASAGIKESSREDRSRWEELWAERFRCRPMEKTIEEWYAQPLFTDFRRSPYFSATFMRRLNNRPEAVANALRSLGQAAQPALWDELSQLSVPLHLVIGEKDEKFRREAEQLKSVLPSTTLTEIKGCGHAVHLENPLALAAVIAEIIQPIVTLG